MVTVAPILVLGKVLSALKDIVVAARFGVGDEVDAFLIALLLPTFAINLISGTLNLALLPVYVQEGHQEGDESANELVEAISFWTIGLLTLASAILLLLAPVILPLLGSRFSATKVGLADNLLLVLMVSLPINGLALLWGAVLNAHDRFFLRAMASLAAPVGPLLFVLLFSSKWGITTLALGTVIGCAAEAVSVGAGVWALSVPIRPRWHRPDQRLWKVLDQFVPMFIGALVVGLNPIVDQSMAAGLGRGSVAAIGFGGKAVAVILSLGGAALSTAIFPHFSTMAAKSEWLSIRSPIRLYGGLALGLRAVPTAAGVLFRPEIVRLMFQHGKFTGEDASLVSSIQSLDMLQLPFSISSLLFVRLIGAMGKSKILMWISVLNLVCNTIGNYVLSRTMGVPGIALSTAGVFLVSSIASGVYVAVHIANACK